VVFNVAWPGAGSRAVAGRCPSLSAGWSRAVGPRTLSAGVSAAMFGVLGAEGCEGLVEQWLHSLRRISPPVVSGVRACSITIIGNELPEPGTEHAAWSYQMCAKMADHSDVRSSQGSTGQGLQNRRRQSSQVRILDLPPIRPGQASAETRPGRRRGAVSAPPAQPAPIRNPACHHQQDAGDQPGCKDTPAGLPPPERGSREDQEPVPNTYQRNLPVSGLTLARHASEDGPRMPGRLSPSPLSCDALVRS
jgi:hypothetical protein